jgi:hypothetical protein
LLPRPHNLIWVFVSGAVICIDQIGDIIGLVEATIQAFKSEQLFDK